MSRSVVLLVVAMAAMAAGCRVGGDVQPIPLRGPMPASIAIWPGAPGPDAADWLPTLLDGLDRASLRHGYRIMSHEVAWTLVTDGRDPRENEAAVAANDVAALGQRLDVDAVLLLDVRRFEADRPERLRSASWDLRWELQSTHGHGVLWSFEHNGSWRPVRDDDDPHRPFDAAEPRPVLIGGDHPPSFRDVRELAYWLSRHAMEHLPARPR